MRMICTVCGRDAEYNEKLNVYYCKEHGFTTWLASSDEEEHMPEVKVGEVVLG